MNASPNRTDDLTANLIVDRETAESAMLLRESADDRLPLIDALIAGCARAHSAVLVHGDPYMSSIPPEMVAQVGLTPKDPQAINRVPGEAEVFVSMSLETAKCRASIRQDRSIRRTLEKRPASLHGLSSSDLGPSVHDINRVSGLSGPPVMNPQHGRTHLAVPCAK